MMREAIDLHEVMEVHHDIHERLLNWARWCRPGRGGGGMLAMFRNYRAEGYHEVVISVPIDSKDGQHIEKVVAALPEKHRTALQWHYVKPYIPVRKVRQALGVTLDGLHDLTNQARAMVKNRA